MILLNKVLSYIVPIIYHSKPADNSVIAISKTKNNKCIKRVNRLKLVFTI